MVAKSIFRALSDNVSDHNGAESQWMGTNVPYAVATIENMLGAESNKQMDSLIEGKVQAMMKVVEFFMPVKEQSEVMGELMQILNLAISFSRILRKQYAYWWVLGPVPSAPQPVVGGRSSEEIGAS